MSLREVRDVAIPFSDGIITPSEGLIMTNLSMPYQQFQVLQPMMWMVIPLMLWVIPWKGVALWKAARNGHKGWFVAILLLNTLAILEIIYILGFSKKRGR